MNNPEELLVQPGGRLTGAVQVPGDKSISHRAVMLGALADGVTEIRDCLLGEDVRSTMGAFRAMGVEIEELEEGRLIRVHGRGVNGLRAPTHDLDMGNSGTSIRLLSGILAGHGIAATLSGDASLQRRPMRRVTDPLGQMGAVIHTGEKGTPPLRIEPGHPLHGIRFEMPVASAQVKSAVLLAGLFAEGETTVIEPAPTRDHTERMLAGCGVEVQVAGFNVNLARVVTDLRADKAAFFHLLDEAGGAVVTDTQAALQVTGAGTAVGGDDFERFFNERVESGVGL
jgi:3-phosphoshikimate 1-carboxyvinyltransferase